jgi:hypothetical protein
MRCDDGIYGSVFSHIDLYIDLEKRVRVDHPLWVIRQIANAALKLLSGEFAKLYSPIGRESVPRERLMHALLLQGLFDPLGAAIARVVSLARHRGRGVDATSFTEKRPAVGWRGGGQLSPGSAVARLRSKDCCRAITSRLMARCWKRRRARRASRKGCLGRAAGSGAQHRTRLPRRAPEE